MTIKIGVVGQGFVGGSLTTVMSERGCVPFVYDITGKIAPGGRDTNAFSLTEFVRMCDEIDVRVIFVCLPTPMTQMGHADLTVVESALAEIAEIPPRGNYERVAVVKSTVPPGTCVSWDNKFAHKGLRVVFNPEFLTEARAIDDMRDQDRIILGGHPAVTPRVADIYAKTFPGVPCIQTSANNAEMVKYVANCFLSVKVSFANEMSQVCEGLTSVGKTCDYDKIIELATLDKRLGSSHWKTPGPDGKAGFGGSCFPKDINAMIRVAQSVRVDPKVLCAAWEKNLEVRPERDWEMLKGRAVV
jgi:UDPglucose 6-dehydrogenase